ncbi:MAG: dihydroorotate dehydrogenase-like protein [Planctomycetes bacterium]|nr:dihydroorotate dehydrogenase-like protein [Planctomycetota bacterium]
MDLKTTYMGMELNGPLVASAGPLQEDLDKLKTLQDAGVSAVVLWSLFEEQISHEARALDYYLEHGTERFAESLTYFPEADTYKLAADDYIEHIRACKDAVDIPIIGSLNGVSAGGWIDYAKQMQDAGADGVELNVYYIPTSSSLTADRVENVYVAILEAVKESVTIPVSMKLSPYFSATANMLQKLDAAGADGLVLFNRFYQPDLDIDNLEVKPDLQLSTSYENRLPLRWIAIMHGRVDASLAATTGIHSGEDLARAILAGADVAMSTSALLTHGLDHAKTMLDGLTAYMDGKEYESVQQMKGVLSQKHCAEPAAFERANYMKTLGSIDLTRTFE